MITVTFNSYSLQSSTVVTTEMQHENVMQKRLNVQKFAEREGGRLIRPDFDVKIITLRGIIKGTSQSNLEDTLDTFKKNLNASEKHLDVEYANGTRRYIATCSKLLFDRKHYTVDVIDWEAEFTVSNPPFGTSIDTSTLEDLANTNTFAATMTGTHDGYADYSGTFRPHPTIKITFNSANGIREVRFENSSEDNFFSSTYITGQKFYDGDVLTIDTKEGTVQVNGTDIDFVGFPIFTLTNNSYSLKVIGKSYNVDLKIIYYSLWL
jgi:hypothetical protein